MLDKLFSGKFAAVVGEHHLQIWRNLVSWAMVSAHLVLDNTMGDVPCETRVASTWCLPGILATILHRLSWPPRILAMVQLWLSARARRCNGRGAGRDEKLSRSTAMSERLWKSQAARLLAASQCTTVEVRKYSVLTPLLAHYRRASRSQAVVLAIESTSQSWQRGEDAW